MNAQTDHPTGGTASWDDLRLVLAVARGGSLSAAARRLGVNHSTVFRRLGNLETALAVRLFDRQARGYAATAAGADLLTTAEAIEEQMIALERRLAGQDLSLSGAIRITAPDDVFEPILAGALARFRQRYPDITLEVAIDNRMLNLTRREADVALRPARSPDDNLVGRRIGRVASRAYLPRALLDDYSGPANLPWAAWEEGSGPPGERAWFKSHVASERIVFRCNSMQHLLTACRTGIGAAVLPCFLGDAHPDLARLPDFGAPLETQLWLLTHPDLRRTARIRAFLDFLYEELRPWQGRLAGEPAAS